MPQQAEEARDLHRVSVRLLDQRAADLHRPDVGAVDGVGRGAFELYDLQHVAVARGAVEQPGDQRLSFRLPALDAGREVVGEAEHRLSLGAVLDERAAGDGARAPRRAKAADQGPVADHAIRRMQGDFRVGARPHAVVVVVQPGIAVSERGMRAQLEATARPGVRPVAEPQLAAPGAVAGVAQHLDIRRAECGAAAHGGAEVEAGLAHRHSDGG